MVHGTGDPPVGRRLNLKPLITHEFSLYDVNEALDTFINRKGGAIKVIIKPGGLG